MKAKIIFATMAISILVFAFLPNIVAAYVPDEGPKAPNYGYNFNLKYTDAKYTNITGTIQNPVSKVTPTKPYVFAFDSARTSETSDHRCVRWFIETPKPSISWYEISALGSCDGLNPQNHKLVTKTAAGLSVTYDIAVNNYQGQPIDNDTPYVAPATPAAAGTSTNEEEPLYALSNRGTTYKIDESSWHTVFGPDNVTTYDEWLKLVWNWTMATMVPLSVLILTAAGVLYTISEGDSNRIGLAKKLIIGVVSGVGLLVLSRVLIAVILGTEGATEWFIFFKP